MAGSLPNITRIAGPLFFSLLVNWGLYGILCVQTCMIPVPRKLGPPTHPRADVYSYNFLNDRLLTKSLVYFVFALETTQTAMTGADGYFWFVGGFGDFERLKNSHFAPIDVPIMTTFISFIVQMYFCYRIWTLTRNVWLCSIITVTSIGAAIGSAWGGIVSLVDTKYAVSKPAIYLWSTSSTVADILIATAMTLLARDHPIRFLVLSTDFFFFQLKRTRAIEGLYSRVVLVRVVRVTIETNMLTASVAIASVVLYAAFPNDIYYTFTVGIIGKLYSNSLLVSLNNRIYFRDRVSGSSGGGESSRLTVSSRVRDGMASIHLPRGEPQSRGPIEVFKLETTTTSNTGDLENGKGADSASINSDPRLVLFSVSVAIQSNTPGPSRAQEDVIQLKTSPSFTQPSVHD
ncbi:hypothetical protein EDB92DRAFT_1970630 [Lactarius akahatsu]|uniref:DUF6534 domain-containing protein n=1 Tax=Lactarius akahatsu TaxID=416441 RepID=A0AAD4LJC9_9AGAM|nr:hypothetical protein EDB92DRAFT_1970630 [Lactarius akahatsu]